MYLYDQYFSWVLIFFKETPVEYLNQYQLTLIICDAISDGLFTSTKEWTEKPNLLALHLITITICLHKQQQHPLFKHYGIHFWIQEARFGFPPPPPPPYQKTAPQLLYNLQSHFLYYSAVIINYHAHKILVTCTYTYKHKHWQFRKLRIKKRALDLITKFSESHCTKIINYYLN